MCHLKIVICSRGHLGERAFRHAYGQEFQMLYLQ